MAQRVHIGVEEKWGSVSALSAGAVTKTLLEMVDRVKGEGGGVGGVHPSYPHQAGLILPS
jgi:hypothetical protein